jgi:hypothetical protein
MGSIVTFLRDKSFSPETIEVMAVALSKAKDFMVGANDETVEMLAMRIISFASHGEHDPDKLAAAAIAPMLHPVQAE